MESNLLYSKSTDLNVNLIQNTLTEILRIVQISQVQSLSHVQLFATPWTAAHQAPLSFTNSRSLLKPTSIESVMPSNPDELSSLLHRTHGCTPLVAVQPWNCRLLWPPCPDCPVLPFSWCSALRITENRLYAIPPCLLGALSGRGCMRITT